MKYEGFATMAVHESVMNADPHQPSRFPVYAGVSYDFESANSTVTTPYLFRAGRFGVNIVVHSATKYISGGAIGTGGVINVKAVKYPGLASSAFFGLSQRQFNGLFGGIVSFELAGKDESCRFLNGLSLIRRAANLGDNKTLAIHPASTIFSEFSTDQRMLMGAGDGIIRLSIGLEDANDIINDIDKGLRGL